MVTVDAAGEESVEPLLGRSANPRVRATFLPNWLIERLWTCKSERICAAQANSRLDRQSPTDSGEMTYGNAAPMSSKGRVRGMSSGCRTRWMDTFACSTAAWVRRVSCAGGSLPTSGGIAGEMGIQLGPSVSDEGYGLDSVACITWGYPVV